MKFSELSNYELFCLVHKCFDLLLIATIEDLIFVLRAIFNARLTETRVRQISSILVGANYLIKTGIYGHYHVNPAKDDLLKLKEGFASQEAELRLELGALYGKSDSEFLSILDGCANAA